MNLPEPGHASYSTLISDIQKGLIKIPQFQREFVWSKEKVAKLLDSVVKGYPIGTFIFWKTKEELRSIRNLGNIALPPTPSGDFVIYVLDGQQRMTSLFTALLGLKVERGELVDEFKNMWVDLESADEDQIVITDASEKEPKHIIRIVDLIEGGAKKFGSYPERFAPRLDVLRDRIRTYNFSTITVREAPIDVATEIFTRLNTGGKPLSVFEIMVAKTFDASKKFDLAEKYAQLIAELQEVDYETVSDATVLQSLAGILKKECQKKHILALKKAEVIDVWKKAVDAIHQSIDYFRSNFHVPVSKLLPYNALIVPFAYFFYHHPKKPVSEKQRFLSDFFWRTSLSGRYSSAVEGKIAQDIKRMDDILAGKLPTYDYPIDTSAEFITSNGYFSAGRSYIKAILSVYASKQPLSFSDSAVVRISNDWLKQANSKNYHHFFPKAYMERERKDVSWDLVNNVLNITIVDDYLNKREIGAQPPSKYLRKFEKQNSELEQTMKTHLINLDRSGVRDDDFERFIKQRAAWVSRELSKRVIPSESDARPQSVNFDDVEEAEAESVIA